MSSDKKESNIPEAQVNDNVEVVAPVELLPADSGTGKEIDGKKKVVSTVSVKEKPKITKIEIKDKDEDGLTPAIKMQRQNIKWYTDPRPAGLEDLDKRLNYVVQCDGIWEVRNTPVGMLCVKVVDRKFPGFPKKENHPWFWLKYGKIPHQILKQILAFFKDICDESKDEVYIQIFWDPKTEKYFNYVPKQKVSGGSVEYERDQDTEKDHVLVCEMHSHNTMSAEFSGIDDKDEKTDRFFGVVGRLDRLKPDITLSYVCGGKRQKIDIEDLFDEVPEEEELFPREWKSRVSKRTFGHHGGMGSENNSSSYDWSTKTRSTGPGQSSGVYRHQTVGASGSYVHQRSSQSFVSQAGSQTSEENAKIESEVEKAFARSLKELNLTLDSPDFLDAKPTADKKVESEVSNFHPHFPHSSSSVDSGNGSNHKTNEDSERLDLLVGQFIASKLQAYAMEEENMDEDTRLELFNNMIQAMNEDDVVVFMQALLNNNHGDLVLDAVTSAGRSEEDNSDVGTNLK